MGVSTIKTVEELLSGRYKVKFDSHDALMDVLPVLEVHGFILREKGKDDPRVVHLYLDSGTAIYEYYGKGVFENDSNKEISQEELYLICGIRPVVPDFDRAQFEALLAGGETWQTI